MLPSRLFMHQQPFITGWGLLLKETAWHFCPVGGPENTLVERALGQHPHLLAERGHHYVWKWCGKAHARSGGQPQHLLCWGSASWLDSWKGGCGHSGCSVSPCGMVLNSCRCTRGPGRERASALASEGRPRHPPPIPR